MGIRFKILVFLLAVASTTFFHVTNNRYLQHDNPLALRKGITVVTNDDASYLAPVHNFLKGNGWKSNAVGKAAYTTRSPGYGLLYLPFRYLLSEKGALIALVIFQILLYGLAVAFVPNILGALYLNKKWKQVLTLSFAILPMFSGFLSYTLTEGITPSLVLISLALMSKTKASARDELLLWLIMAFLILVRPPMIVWAFALPIRYFPYKRREAQKLILGTIVLLASTLVWQYHLYKITDDFQGLHPIYQDDSNTVYRPPHESIWNFHKAWGQTGEEFHKNIGFLASAARYNRKRDEAVNRIMDKIPARVKNRVREDSLSVYYGLYYDVLQSQAANFKSQQPISGLSSNEVKLIDFYKRATKEYSSSDFFYSRVIVPFQVFKRLALHSNLSLYIFQKPWRGNPFIETLRIICFANHSLAFYVFLVSIFVLFTNRKALIIILPTALYLGYLCFIQRGVEERYTLPFLIPVVALSAKTLELIYRRSLHLIKGQ